ncbi:MAG: HIRAN domain-containing protein [Campylobacter sp.]|nr:HIRAN domain-containing protein [Campylobacter sp.]
MKEQIYISITGLTHYYGKKPFAIGRVVRLKKEPNNEHDNEAINVSLPFIGKIGYVANSVNTTYLGTSSAGKIYDKIGKTAFAKIMFITHSSAIALIVDENEAKFDNIWDN